MRCFISIELPEEIKKELAKAEKDLQKIAEETKAKLRIVKPENLHITIKFLGEISDDKINKIKDALKTIKFDSFKVKLNSFGIFPSQNYIRVVWVDILPKEKIIELEQKIISILVGQGFKKEHNFETHITLARIKVISSEEKENFVKAIKKIKIEPLEFEINNFVLEKSILTPEGPIYEDIATFPSI